MIYSRSYLNSLKIEDLKAEDIQKNVKVEGDIYYFMDYYAYQENDKGGMTAMQFIPLDIVFQPLLKKRFLFSKLKIIL